MKSPRLPEIFNISGFDFFFIHDILISAVSLLFTGSLYKRHLIDRSIRGYDDFFAPAEK